MIANHHKVKTIEQRIREALIWAKAEREKARQRQKEAARITNLKTRYGAEYVQEIIKEKATRERTRDRLASRIGMKGRTFDKAVKVIQCIDHLMSHGDLDQATALREILNYKSIDAAYRLVVMENAKRSEAIEKMVERLSKREQDIRGMQNCFSCPPSTDSDPRLPPQNDDPCSEKANHKLGSEMAKKEGEAHIQDVVQMLNKLDSDSLRCAADEFARNYTKYYCLGIIDEVKSFSEGQLVEVIKAISKYFSIEQLLKV